MHVVVLLTLDASMSLGELAIFQKIRFPKLYFSYSSEEIISSQPDFS